MKIEPLQSLYCDGKLRMIMILAEFDCIAYTALQF